MNNGRLGYLGRWRYGALAFVLIVGPAWAVTAPPVTPTRIFDMRPVMDGVTGKITYQLGSGSGVLPDQNRWH